jgi:hypothetical protein
MPPAHMTLARTLSSGAHVVMLSPADARDDARGCWCCTPQPTPQYGGCRGPTQHQQRQQHPYVGHDVPHNFDLLTHTLSPFPPLPPLPPLPPSLPSLRLLVPCVPQPHHPILPHVHEASTRVGERGGQPPAFVLLVCLLLLPVGLSTAFLCLLCLCVCVCVLCPVSCLAATVNHRTAARDTAAQDSLVSAAVHRERQGTRTASHAHTRIGAHAHARTGAHPHTLTQL